MDTRDLKHHRPIKVEVVSNRIECRAQNDSPRHTFSIWHWTGFGGA